LKLEFIHRKANGPHWKTIPELRAAYPPHRFHPAPTVTDTDTLLKTLTISDATSSPFQFFVRETEDRRHFPSRRTCVVVDKFATMDNESYDFIFKIVLLGDSGVGE